MFDLTEIPEKQKLIHKNRTSKRELRKKLAKKSKSNKKGAKDRKTEVGAKKQEELLKKDTEEDEKPPKPWIENEALGNGETVLEISKTEENFWNNLIKKYLYPLDESNVDKAGIGQGLRALRNR